MPDSTIYKLMLNFWCDSTRASITSWNFSCYRTFDFSCCTLYWVEIFCFGANEIVVQGIVFLFKFLIHLGWHKKKVEWWMSLPFDVSAQTRKQNKDLTHLGKAYKTESCSKIISVEWKLPMNITRRRNSRTLFMSVNVNVKSGHWDTSTFFFSYHLLQFQLL